MTWLALTRKIAADHFVLANDRDVIIAVTMNQKPMTDDDRCTCNAEELLCYSMLSKLVKNAVEASPPKNTVQINLVSKSLVILIQVINQGVVPEVIRKSFFDKYSTVGKHQGTGIGTYSAKLMAEVQGGLISMQTSIATGTIVTVELPLLV